MQPQRCSISVQMVTYCISVLQSYNSPMYYTICWLSRQQLLHWELVLLLSMSAAFSQLVKL